MSHLDSFDIHDYLAKRSEIAIILTVEDVQEIRPDLNAEQAWKVLQYMQNDHDCSFVQESFGLIAQHLFEPSSCDGVTP